MQLENAKNEANFWLDKSIDFITDYGPKVIGALLIWIIGSWVIKKIKRYR